MKRAQRKGHLGQAAGDYAQVHHRAGRIDGGAADLCLRSGVVESTIGARFAPKVVHFTQITCAYKHMYFCYKGAISRYKSAIFRLKGTVFPSIWVSGRRGVDGGGL
jgi:hypothetical protein